MHRIVCAVDCGTVVNPDTVKAQMEEEIIFGISGALWGEVTIEKGRVQFHELLVRERRGRAPVAACGSRLDAQSSGRFIFLSSAI